MKATLKMLALPILGFAFASAGAVSTSSNVESKAGMPPMTGYILNASGGCGEAVNVRCNLTTGPVCEASGQQVWAKDAQGRCIVFLHRD